jgi:hypothetical protein
MRRILTWLLSTISVVVLLFGYHTSTSGALATAPTQAPVGASGGGASNPGAAGSSGSGSGGSGDDTSGGSGTSGSKTVTGSTADTQWGPVQVQVTTNGGTITDVEVVQYPSGNSKDEEINAYALPILVKGTLDSQSGDVDMVSGATVTSAGYEQSLQSALDKAGL